MVYKGIFPEQGICVSEEDAYDFAIGRLIGDKSLHEEFVKWFYSGNFVQIKECERINDGSENN